jgi:hypothetical protein
LHYPIHKPAGSRDLQTPFAQQLHHVTSRKANFSEIASVSTTVEVGITEKNRVSKSTSNILPNLNSSSLIDKLTNSPFPFSYLLHFTNNDLPKQAQTVLHRFETEIFYPSVKFQ